jgi:hypothetical protein
MSAYVSASGVKSSTGQNIDWSNINEERQNDPTLSALMKEVKTKFIEKKEIDLSLDLDNSISMDMYIQEFNSFLKQNGFSTIFLEKDTKKDSAKDSSKKSAKKLTSKEALRLDILLKNQKRDLTIFSSSIVIQNHLIILSRNYSNNFKVIFLNIIFWTIYLIKKKDSDIHFSIFLDCEISLYRVLQDFNKYIIEELSPELLEDIIKKSNKLLIKLKEITESKKSRERINEFIVSNPRAISYSFWDREKPNSTSLYFEQNTVLSLIQDCVENNKAVLGFYNVPPGGGKTQLAPMAARVISEINKLKKHDMSFPNKVLLFICSNIQVRDDVGIACRTSNIDVKFGLAYQKYDSYDNKFKSFVKFYKNCYHDWNNKRKMKTQKQQDEDNKRRYHDDIRVQLEFYLSETRPIKEQIHTIENFDKAEWPEMIISDLESAVVLIEAYPERFVLYFDEACAAYDLPVTAKIMSILPKVSFLVSATVAEPEEIPTVIETFKRKYELEDTTFIKVIKSAKQHISCTFIDPDGYIFMPHSRVTTIEELSTFLQLLEKKPLLKRSYSLEVVFKMSEIVDDFLSTEMKFKKRFTYTGLITQESIRLYGFEILYFIRDNNRLDLLEKLNQSESRILKIHNIEPLKILTTGAVYYQSGKTLCVSSNNGFSQYIENIAQPLLSGSPRISDIIQNYQRDSENLSKELKSLEKNGDKDSEMDRHSLRQEMSELKLRIPGEFIINSTTHASKFGNLKNLEFPNSEIFGTIDDFAVLDDTRALLFMSGIGIYQPDEFRNSEMNLFLKNKDRFKMIFSDPSIVYGTNINLTIVRINKSFLNHSTQNSLYQLIGRAGRKGRSDSATIIFEDIEMLNMILNGNTTNIESELIERNIKSIIE